MSALTIPGLGGANLDRLVRVNDQYRAAHSRALAANTAWLEAHNVWRLAELEVSRAAIRALDQTSARRAVALALADLESWSEKCVIANASLEMAKQARQRLARGE